VHEYLETLDWDGKRRIETMFIDYLGSEDNIYTREAALCWFSAAIHRVFDPGCKFDYVPVLGGEQGILKTTFVRELALGKWFGELSSFDPKISMEEIHGKWIIEIAELSANTKSELEQQKSFLSAQSTRTRMAYARRAQEFKRQCVFMGTTNSKEYLKDSTGNRRWWPIDVTVNKINIDRLKAEINLIWGEAYQTLYVYSRPMFLSDEAETLAKEVQESKREPDPWEGIIIEWLDSPADPGRYDRQGTFGAEAQPRDRVCVLEIWEDCLNFKHDPKPAERRRISAIMNKMKEWERTSTARFGTRFGRQKGWLKEAKIVNSYGEIPF
jgi:predicted P-loop ATPase